MNKVLHSDIKTYRTESLTLLGIHDGREELQESGVVPALVILHHHHQLELSHWTLYLEAGRLRAPDHSHQAGEYQAETNYILRGNISKSRHVEPLLTNKH